MENHVTLMNECAVECLRTVRHCLEQGGEYATPELVGALLDCADACHMAAAFTARGSLSSNEACRFSAERCQTCEDNCEQLSVDDEILQHCMATCRACAKACVQMAL